MRFLIRHDRRQRLYFAPLQGITARAILPAQHRESLASVVYYRVAEDDSATILRQSDAALLALIDTQSHWRHLARLIRMLPLGPRDRIYYWIARNRDKFFKRAACFPPTNAEHARILP